VIVSVNDDISYAHESSLARVSVFRRMASKEFVHGGKSVSMGFFQLSPTHAYTAGSSVAGLFTRAILMCVDAVHSHLPPAAIVGRTAGVGVRRASEAFVSAVVIHLNHDCSLRTQSRGNVSPSCHEAFSSHASRPPRAGWTSHS